MKQPARAAVASRTILRDQIVHFIWACNLGHGHLLSYEFAILPVVLDMGGIVDGQSKFFHLVA